MHEDVIAWPTHSFRAMGCQISFWLEANADDATNAFAQAQALFAANERTLSRFDASSELSVLNSRAGQWTVVSPLLWDVVNQALDVTARTGGLFDPTLLDALEAAGYTRSFDVMLADVNPIDAATCKPQPAHVHHNGWTRIELDQARTALRLPPGMRLDLGGIGKGYTAQQAVRLLSQWGPCLVDAGGDVVAGAAPHGLPGWPVAVAAPFLADEPGQNGTPAHADAADDLLQLWLADAALATSGIDYRRWRQNGRWRHHLIDPRTGEPAVTDLLSASVLHRRAVCAEAWAKVALLLGMQAGFTRLTELHVAGALAGADGQVRMTPALTDFLAQDDGQF